MKLYNTAKSLILEIALYPLTISQHADRGSFRFIIPYEQEIAKSFIVWAKMENGKNIKAKM